MNSGLRPRTGSICSVESDFGSPGAGGGHLKAPKYGLRLCCVVSFDVVLCLTTKTTKQTTTTRQHNTTTTQTNDTQTQHTTLNTQAP